MQTHRQIEEVAKGIISLLLQNGEAAELIMIPGDDETTIRVLPMSRSAAFRLIDPHGRTLQSLRIILRAVGVKLGRRCRFEVDSNHHSIH